MNAVQLGLCVVVVVLIMSAISALASSALAPIIAFLAMWWFAWRYVPGPLAALIDRITSRRRAKRPASTGFVRLTYR